VGTIEQIPPSLEMFRATLDALGYPVGEARASVFLRLPEHVQNQVWREAGAPGKPLLRDRDGMERSV
jgi:hypothetical protein